MSFTTRLTYSSCVEARIVCKQSLSLQLSLRSPEELILTGLQNFKDNVCLIDEG